MQTQNLGARDENVGLTPYTTRILQAIQQDDPIANKSVFVRIDSQVVSGVQYWFVFKVDGQLKEAKAWAKAVPQGEVEITTIDGQKLNIIMQ